MDIGRTLPAHVSADPLVDAYARVAAEGMIHVDARRRIARFNPSAERILGYASAGVIGSAFSSLLHDSNRADVFAAVAMPEPQITNVTFRDSTGAPVPARARCVTLLDAAQAKSWIVAFNTRRRVEEIEQLKTELVSTVSHELKTPLATIKAYTATLRANRSLYESHSQEFLEVVEHEADRLLRMIEDMLLVARVDTAQLLRKRVSADLAAILDEAIAQVPHDPVTHPIERRFENVRVCGDPDRLRDILRNLLENAVKYSPNGGLIEVRAQEHPGYTSIAVEDRGAGISEESLPFIFDRFYRADDEAASHAGGSGLGLYIVQALVRAHGGTIDVRSALGRGTTFTLSLPVRP